MKHCYYLTFKEVIDCHLIPLGTWTQLTVPLLPLPPFVTVGFTPRRGGQSGFPFCSSFHPPSHLPNLLLTLSQNCLFCLWSTFLRPNGTFFNDRPFLFFLFRVNFSMAKRSIFQLTRTGSPQGGWKHGIVFLSIERWLNKRCLHISVLDSV